MVIILKHPEDLHMRYEKGHKENTRQHILNVASKLFRKGGIEAVGLASVMKEAGLTNGAFYAHFNSKEDLVREIVASTFDNQQESFIDAVKHGLKLEDVIRDYLSPEHRDNSEESCPAASLLTEISRHTEETRKVFSEKVHCMLDLFSSQIKEENPVKRERKAIAIYAQLIGSLQLARVDIDSKKSDLILASGIESALELANLKDQ